MAASPVQHRAARVDTTLVRAAAALLVANSHFEHFYPIAWLAGDGLIGNSLFFFLAGYGLERSAQRVTPKFANWFGRRIGRMYPSVWVAVAAFALLAGGGWHAWSAGDYGRQFLWPTDFTFVEFVVPFYVLFFPLLRSRRSGAYVGGILALVVVYLAYYIPDAMSIEPGTRLELGSRHVILMHAAAYLQVMLLGGIVARREDRGLPAWTRSIFTSFAIGGVYVAAKYLMVHGTDASAYGLLHLLTFAFCLTSYAFLTRPDVVALVKRATWAWRPLALVGSLTLEIYLVNNYLVQYHWLYSIVFPLDLVAVWALTMALAVLLAKVVARVEPSARRRRAAAADAPVPPVRAVESPAA